MSTDRNRNESLISIVDDEPRVRKSLGRLMRSAGYRTREYRSAEDFLAWGWWDEAACLILDVRLPAMSGLELQRYLADRSPKRPIVFISGQATENEHTWGMMKGAVAFLPKPLNERSLLRAVDEAIARRPADSSFPDNPVCPLCSDSVHVAEVPNHLVLDHVDLRAPAVEMIQTLNPMWSEKEGLCYRCWEFYVGLGRVLNWLHAPSPDLAEGHVANTKV